MSDANEQTPFPSDETYSDAEELVPAWLTRAVGQSRNDWLSMLRAHQHRCWYLGRRVPAEAYLRRLPELHPDGETALDLVCSEVLLRAELGETPTRDEYLRRFPQFGTALRSHFRLRQALTGDSPLTRSYDGSPPASPLPSQQASPAAAPETTGRGPPIVPGYEILGELGRGGMGVVYKARQMRPRRLVALKMILTEETVNAEKVAPFYGEAEMIARLRHPNIVQLYEVGEHAGRAYLSLEYLGGGSLTQQLAGRPLPVADAAEMVAALAGALHHVHQHGILHRDLKPANILLSADGTPKLIDFGLAVYRDQLAEPVSVGRVLGTPSYMAPEQAKGCSATIGSHTDVFGLGVVLYEVLTGVPPYRGADHVAVWKQARRGAVVPPRRLNRQVPRSLERICLRALAAEPLRRYASALELEQALRRYLRWSRLAPLGWGLGLGLTGLLAAEALALAVWNR